LAYLGEITDKGFRTAEEIRRRLGLPVIGHIPLLTPDAASRDKVQAGEPALDPYLCACHRPKSVEAEAYRAVRTALYFSTHGAGHSVFQVTSPDKGDGKSTLVTNLAVCMAQSGKKTIVIDADLRRPRLHRMFAQVAPCGLADVIAGRVAWRDAVRAGPVPNLFILPCGPVPSNPAELLTSPAFQALLDEVRAEYDFVLVDTPPLLAVTDPCVVAPRVDGVILTLRLSKKSGPQAERAREILSSLGVNVVGVVVNGVTTRSGAARYGGGQYEYIYGSHEYTAEADETSDGYYGEGDANETPRSPAADAAAATLGQRSPRPAPVGGAARHGLLRWFQKLCGL
jgi:capsular exopolysaccharide synthesis family protein